MLDFLKQRKEDIAYHKLKNVLAEGNSPVLVKSQEKETDEKPEVKPLNYLPRDYINGSVSSSTASMRFSSVPGVA